MRTVVGLAQKEGRDDRAQRQRQPIRGGPRRPGRPASAAVRPRQSEPRDRSAHRAALDGRPGAGRDRSRGRRRSWTIEASRSRTCPTCRPRWSSPHWPRACPGRLPDQARRPRRQRRLRRDGQPPVGKPDGQPAAARHSADTRRGPGEGDGGGPRGAHVRPRRHRSVRGHRPALARWRGAPRRPAARAATPPRFGRRRVRPRPARRVRPSADRRLARDRGARSGSTA